MSAITKQILGGAKWTSLSTLLITVIQIGQFALLGNLMTISEFGLVGMITTITVFAQIIFDMGIGAALIQKEKVTDNQLSTLYWLNILFGLLVFGALFALSPLIADFYHREELTGLIQILSIMFIIAPFGQQFQYLLQKDLNFQLLSKIEVLSILLSFAVLIIMIFSGSSIVAYVISQVFLYSFRGLAYFAVYQKKWRPSFVFKLTEVKEFFSFGGFQLASRLVNRIGANIDMILIGRFLGAEALGIYNLAYQIVTIPVLKINPIITRVAFPIFSKHQNDHKVISEGFLNMTKMLSFITFPLLIGLIAVSELFIEVFFGERWLVAIPVLNVLAIVGILRVIMNPNGSVLLAKGRADLAFYWDFGVMILYGLSLYAAVMSGNLLMVAWIYAAVSFINFLIGRWLVKYLIRLSIKDYAAALMQPLLLTLIMAGVAYCVNVLIQSILPDKTVLQLSLSVAISAVCYGILVFLFNKQIVRNLFNKRTRGQLR
ncbi:teichuronic acid biosynthesis protein TuaB [Bacillus gobiensis]|uniref:teichuronic acid biosynthesis protein TuaB n=1 Tax=Bacillus gobiensis TaxID=1441095 RepID=UPI003D1EB349